MEQLREVSKAEKIVFPVVVSVLCILLLPSVAPLIGMLMLGNLLRESGVTERLSKTAQNELMNIVTIFLGVSVGAKAVGERFLQPETLKVIALGLIAFAFSTVGGILLGKLMFGFQAEKSTRSLVLPVCLQYRWLPEYPKLKAKRPIRVTFYSCTQWDLMWQEL